jgi:hypothetical protein
MEADEEEVGGGGPRPPFPQKGRAMTEGQVLGVIGNALSLLVAGAGLIIYFDKRFNSLHDMLSKTYKRSDLCQLDMRLLEEKMKRGGKS